MNDLRAGEGILQFVSVDPVQNVKFWPKNKKHKTKRFILIKPRSNSQIEYVKSFTQPPISILSVAARVNEIRPDIECIVIHEAMGDVFPTDLNPEHDIVGITGASSIANYAYKWAVKLRIQYPELPIICGGPHFTFQSEEALYFFDVVFQGETENVLPMFFDDIEGGRLKPIYDGRKYPVDITRPDFPLLEPKKYLQQQKKYVSNILLTSRGCNNRCIFCAEQAFSGHGIRYKHIDNIRRQLELYDEKPVLFLADDNIMADRKRAIELAHLFKSFKVAWLCHANMTIGDDPELLEILGKCGCIMLVIGIESIEDGQLDQLIKSHVNKPVDYDRQLKNIREIGGMGVYGEFILWYDGFKYPDGLKRLAEWIKTQKTIETYQITIETPLPGTELRRLREAQGRIATMGPFGKKITWDDYDLLFLTEQIPNMSPEDVENTLNWMYGELYGVTSWYKWKLLPRFLKTHFVYGKSSLKNKVVGTVYSMKFHQGIKQALDVKLHELSKADPSIRGKSSKSIQRKIKKDFKLVLDAHQA